MIATRVTQHAFIPPLAMLVSVNRARANVREHFEFIEFCAQKLTSVITSFLLLCFLTS